MVLQSVYIVSSLFSHGMNLQKGFFSLATILSGCVKPSTAVAAAEMPCWEWVPPGFMQRTKTVFWSMFDYHHSTTTNNNFALSLTSPWISFLSSLWVETVENILWVCKEGLLHWMLWSALLSSEVWCYLRANHSSLQYVQNYFTCYQKIPLSHITLLLHWKIINSLHFGVHYFRCLPHQGIIQYFQVFNREIRRH